MPKRLPRRKGHGMIDRMELNDDIDFNQWIAFGMEKGWCGPPVCETHDGFPMSEQEVLEFEEHDPCIHMVRLYEDENHKAAVEEAHSPSVWRKQSY